MRKKHVIFIVSILLFLLLFSSILLVKEENYRNACQKFFPNDEISVSRVSFSEAKINVDNVITKFSTFIFRESRIFHNHN